LSFSRFRSKSPVGAILPTASTPLTQRIVGFRLVLEERGVENLLHTGSLHCRSLAPGERFFCESRRKYWIFERKTNIFCAEIYIQKNFVDVFFTPPGA